MESTFYRPVFKHDVDKQTKRKKEIINGAQRSSLICTNNLKSGAGKNQTEAMKEKKISQKNKLFSA